MTRGPDPAGRRPNHLQGQTSPYLLQHLYNPVDWHPWGDAALDLARNEDRPIFLSIGYAACHWCHVMERESFEDAAVAGFLNQHFVPIKVDREERPDLDEIYMNAVQLMTGQGGWPLNIFLTPQLRPFIGGTYFPPEDRHGMTGFPEILRRVHLAWATRRDEIEQSASRMEGELQRIAAGPPAATDAPAVGRAQVARAVVELTQRFDPQWGGFGPAPKFPADGALTLLLDEHAHGGEAVPLQMVERTLDCMALGGIYDHIGGGFARYSVDERWLVPHFEKMLYNQALLVPNLVDAWLITRKPLYRAAAEQTLDFVRRELTDPAGGFYSSLDADSEGQEGRFYVWSPDEIAAELGADDARLFSDLYGVTPAGNFEGKTILNLLGGSLAERASGLETDEAALRERLEPMRRRLLDVRERRVRPATDDKVLTAWNGLMITACARAHQAFGRQEDLRSARRAADFARAELLSGQRLRVSYREGRAQLNGYLDDYAFLARGLLDLYEAAFDPGDLLLSSRLAATMLARFGDREHGGFYFTSDDHDSLLTRNRSLHDGALPSGAGVATELLLRLAAHLARDDFRAAAERALPAVAAALERSPSAFSSLLFAAGLAEEPPQEIAILGEPSDPATRALLSTVRSRYRRRPAVQFAAAGSAEGAPMLEGKQPLDGKPTAFVCRNRACRKPTQDPAELARQLGDA